MNKFLIFMLVVCLCKSIDAFCAKRCGEPWTRGSCETCACAAPVSTSCANCPISDCGCAKNMNKCSCTDPECQCLKSRVRFPEVEYPMSISEMKPCIGCCV